MNATLARKLRFSDAVYAINTTPKALRNWLQREQVQIHSPERGGGGGWLEFSFYDIAILALVRKFVDFGVNVRNASGLANSVMTQFFPQILHVHKPDEMPADALALMWSNARLRAYPVGDGDQWMLEYSPNYAPKPEPANTYLVMDVSALFLEAFKRADESANEGIEE